MATKKKSKTAQIKIAPKTLEDLQARFHAAAATHAIDARKELLAMVAGAVAAGLVTSPTPSIATPSGMATAAVDIAEEILKKAGILPSNPRRRRLVATNNLGHRLAG